MTDVGKSVDSFFSSRQKQRLEGNDFETNGKERFYKSLLAVDLKAIVSFAMVPKALS